MTHQGNPQAPDPITPYLDLFMEIGKEMLEAGAEIHRVEDTIFRLCHAYEMEGTEIFAIRSLILVSVKDGAGQVYTHSRRIYNLGIHMGRLEDLNDLSRHLCAKKPEPEEIRRLLDQCCSRRYVSSWEMMAGYALAASSFACFFGGGLRDGIAAGCLGLVLYAMDQKLQKANQRLLYTVAASMVLGFCARLWNLFGDMAGLGFMTDKIMIGTIMLLIPGMAFMNSIRDMLNNNAINGLFSCLDAVLTAAAIAAGFAIPMMIMGGI